MDITDPSAQSAATITKPIYRCKICGIESPEVACFAAIASAQSYSLQGTCITCNQPAGEQATWRRIVAMIVLIAGPTTYIAGTRGTQQVGLGGLMIIAAVILPIITFLHELGHAITARAIGLEVTLITIGTGRFVWAARVLNFPVRFYAVPLSGLTLLGGEPKTLVRTRMWLTLLMGPVTNFVLMAPALLFWRPLANLVDANILILWIAYNALMAAGNLWPRRSLVSGHASDGLQLIQTPFKKPQSLAEALDLGPVGALFVRFRDGDYVGAKHACIERLHRSPENPWLLILLSACHINLGDYESARASIDPLLDSSAQLQPLLRAAAQNNFALAVWLRDFNAIELGQSLQRASALTADTYMKFPCVLAHRSTRALLLTASKRPKDALELLAYTNYDRGSRSDRSHREISRAFALRQLARHDEAEQALARAFKLKSEQLPYLRTLGLIQ
jgi:tetratricopeptide (TPR) repeat protein